MSFYSFTFKGYFSRRFDLVDLTTGIIVINQIFPSCLLTKSTLSCWGSEKNHLIKVLVFSPVTEGA